MTEQQHPITLPPELLKEIWDKFQQNPIGGFDEAWRQAMAQAAQWGADQAKANIERERQEVADQELEACCEFIYNETSDDGFVAILRAARRPKPKSEKQQALDILNDAHRGDLSDDERATIRRALKSIPNPS